MTYADRIPLTRPVPTTRHRLDDARSHALEVERDDLRIQVGREQADNRAMMRDRDQALAERDEARQLATFRQGVNDRHRQELGAAGEVIAVVRDAVERIDRAMAAYDTQQQQHVSVLGWCIACGSKCPNGRCPNDASPRLGSPAPRAQDEPDSDARRLLDQAIDAALPLAGGRVAELLDALRCELARVDAKRAEKAEG